MHWLVPNNINEFWVECGLGSVLRFSAQMNIVSALNQPGKRNQTHEFIIPKGIKNSIIVPGKNEGTIMGHGVLKGLFKWSEQSYHRD